MPPRTKPTFFTFEECRAYVRSCKVRSFKAWVAFKQRDPRAPSNPQRTYKAEWKGWTDFLGGTYRQRLPKNKWAPLAKVRTYARGLGLKNIDDWMALSKKGLLPPWAPTAPRQVYGKEFAGWSDFLGHEDWMTYEEFCSYVRDTLKITTGTAWKRVERDQLDPRVPRHPDRAYKGRGWAGWPALFGTTRHSTASTERGKSLTERFPEIAAEWHSTKNCDLKPEQVTASSSKAVWWKCSKVRGHEWKAMVKARTSGAGSCLQCKSDKSLAAKFPELAAEWHPDNEHNAHEITSTSVQRVRWQCPLDPSHQWEGSPATRTIQGTGCPHCAGRRATHLNNLAVLHPEVAQEWHPTKNKKPATQIPAGSHMVAWWLCPNGHEFQREVRMRVRGDECPQCTKRAASPSYNLQVLHPDLASEWHSTKNGDLKAVDFTPGSKTKIWWQCKGEGKHVWEAVIGNRVKWSGCRDCERRWTLNNIRTFVSSLASHLSSFTPGELWVIFQQSGALAMDGWRRREFFKALATGRFPQEEIDRFIAGEKSSVDDFLIEASATTGDEESERPVEDGIDDDIAIDGVGESLAPLPIVNVPGVLRALNAAVAHANDQEAVAFLIESAKAKLWRMVFRDQNAAIAQARAFVGEGYADTIKKEFLHEYEKASRLATPSGYNFRIDGNIEPPNLMQRLIASRDDRRSGNWSGTGAGKTNAAILKTRVVAAKLTIVCCPNSVVEGWNQAIKAEFPDSTVLCKTFEPAWRRATDHLYLVLNYEMFQQPGAEGHVRKFVERHLIDFVVIDEIQFVKQRSEDISRRRLVVGGMLMLAAQKNPDLYVHGMSATPVVNNLREGIALVEMITGREHADLGTQASQANCMKLYQRLTTLGPRWMPDHHATCEQREIRVDCAPFVEEIRGLGRSGTPLQLEEILTRARLPTILDNIERKTLIYTHYVGGAERIDRTLWDAIVAKGWRVGLFTGDEKSGLDGFLHGDLDVLIASSAISTGVDGLQHVCNRLIINVLPWTAAEFDQLIGRIHRQGQKRNVEVLIPLTTADVNGQEWSWCTSKMQRLQFKRSIADAAVDGVVHEGHLRSEAQMFQDQKAWLDRLSQGQFVEADRPVLVFALPEVPESFEKRLAHFGDFSRMNARWNNAESTTTHGRLQDDPTEWSHYHEELGRIRKAWPVDPQEAFILWAQLRTDLVIGDFGCGRAKIRKALIDRHCVHSFDHVAANADVVACDMAHVPLDVDTLDVALFCLSLMGSNVTDYLREAYRTLKLDGWLHLYVEASRFSDQEGFVGSLRDLGFGNIEVAGVGAFTHVSARKTEHHRQADAELRGFG